MDKETARIVIIGAGCFGISSAYHFLKHGYSHVVVLDRASELPAADAASTDLNKVIRSSYGDLFYARFAQDAIAQWKRAEWEGTYHESGVLFMDRSFGTHYAQECYTNDIALGSRVSGLKRGIAVRDLFPEGVNAGQFRDTDAFMNYSCGWAEAARAMALMTERVVSMGAELLSGKTVNKLSRQEGRTTGVECTDGSAHDADLVVIATGAWTASAFPELGLQHKIQATGQSIVHLELSNEDAAKMRVCPVVVDWAAGLTAFPPNKNNIMKFNIHSAGLLYTRQAVLSGEVQSDVSTPRTFLSHGAEGTRIPKEELGSLRTLVREVYPDLTGMPLKGSRLCWYTDAPDGDWIIGFYPSDPALLLATGGSGHAFKFLPVLGQLVVDAAEHTLLAELVKKFAVDREYAKNDLSRAGGHTKQLVESELISPADLHL